MYTGVVYNGGMPEVNNINAIITVAAPPVVLRKKKKGKQPLPEARRRVILSSRVMPTTMEYLKSLGYTTPGRALDVLVKSVQHGGIQAMMKNKGKKVVSTHQIDASGWIQNPSLNRFSILWARNLKNGMITQSHSC